MMRDFQEIDDDIVREKRIIKEMLYSDPDIIALLDNPDLDPEVPDEYVGVNIFPEIHLEPVQSRVNNFICFDIDIMNPSDKNTMMIEQVCTFRIFCHEDTISTKYGGERHDLLAYCVRELFHWSNILGIQLKLTYDVAGTTDTRYVCRTLKFKMIAPNAPYKNRMENKFYEQ